MTDLSITAANVVSGAGAKIERDRYAGASVTAGQTVYLDPATNKYGLADTNSATAAIRAVRGIALHAASLNQPLAVHRQGPITIGGTLTVGETYYASETPGGIEPSADVGSGEYPTVLGIAISTTVLDVNIQSSTVAK